MPRLTQNEVGNFRAAILGNFSPPLADFLAGLITAKRFTRLPCGA
jgi:hypothetical protein